jgi:hypothetical protein
MAQPRLLCCAPWMGLVLAPWMQLVRAAAALLPRTAACQHGMCAPPLCASPPPLPPTLEGVVACEFCRDVKGGVCAGRGGGKDHRVYFIMLALLVVAEARTGVEVGVGEGVGTVVGVGGRGSGVVLVSLFFHMCCACDLFRGCVSLWWLTYTRHTYTLPLQWPSARAWPRCGDGDGGGGCA